MSMLSKAEACAILGIVPRTMSRYLVSDDPPPFTTDNRGRRQFDRDAVIEWWAKSRPIPITPKDPTTGRFVSKT